MKILVVDDEPHILKIIKARLEANNYQVAAACDGDECLQKLITEKPDLILLDIVMPNIDGYEVLFVIKEMKKLQQKPRPIPIIALTARVDEKLRRLVANGEIKSYIIKPFQPQGLLNEIEKVLNRNGR